MRNFKLIFLVILTVFNTGGCSRNIEANSNKISTIQIIKADKYNLKKAYSKYSKTISYIAKYNGIPENLIYSFLVVENGKFDPCAVSTANAIGLLQVRSGTANDIIIMANKNNELSHFDRQMLYNFLGKEKTKKLLNKTILGTSTIITDSDLKKPELNLVIGVLFLKILHKESKGDISKIGIRYLNGYFAFDCGNNIPEKRLKSSNYVVKLTQIHNDISKTKTNNYYHG